MNLLYSKTNSQFELIDIKYIEDISDSDIDNIEYIKDIYYFPNFNNFLKNLVQLLRVRSVEQDQLPEHNKRKSIAQKEDFV